MKVDWLETYHEALKMAREDVVRERDTFTDEPTLRTGILRSAQRLVGREVFVEKEGCEVTIKVAQILPPVQSDEVFVIIGEDGSRTAISDYTILLTES